MEDEEALKDIFPNNSKRHPRFKEVFFLSLSISLFQTHICSPRTQKKEQEKKCLWKQNCKNLNAGLAREEICAFRLMLERAKRSFRIVDINNTTKKKRWHEAEMKMKKINEATREAKTILSKMQRQCSLKPKMSYNAL